MDPMTSQTPPVHTPTPNTPTAHTPTPPHLRETDNAIRTLQGAMHVLFIVLLLVGFARALVAGANPALTSVAVVVFVAVYLSGLLLERRVRAEVAGASTPTSAQRSGTLWIVTLIVGWALLLCIATDFVWIAFALYFLALHVARKPLSFGLVGVILAISVAAFLLSNSARPGLIIGPIMGMLVALGISWVYSQLRRENEARKHLVDELLASHEDLLAAQEALAQTQRDAGVLTERTRLARDIHDTLAQSFSSVLLLSRAGLARTPDDDVLRQIEAQAQSGLADARSVVHALAPSELGDAPLASAISRLAQRVSEQTGITVTTDTDGEPYPLATTLDVALLRIAQSALANVRQHSRATRCAITLSYEPGGVRLEIIDDGIGFTDADVASAPLRGSGFGLRGIRSRVVELGGSFDIESAPGEGTAVIASLPTLHADRPSRTATEQRPSQFGSGSHPESDSPSEGPA